MNYSALPELTLPQMLREQARTRPDAIAIRQKDFGIWKPVRWTDYHRRASHFGLGLLALGLPAGGHLGIISENRIEWVLAQMGAGLVGAVTVGVYPTSPSNERAITTMGNWQSSPSPMVIHVENERYSFHVHMIRSSYLFE